MKYLIALLVAALVGIGAYMTFTQKGDIRTEDENIDTQRDTQREHDSWGTSSTDDVTFQYPLALPVFYMEATDWPPQIEIRNEPYACTEGGDITSRAGVTTERIIDSMPYCVTEIVEGAAGSIYTQYAFVFEKEGKTVALTFSIRSVQCGNFDEVQRASCELERSAFDVGQTVHEIVRTLQFQ